MDKIKICLFVALAFTCLTQLVTPIPMIIDAELDDDTNMHDQITEDIFDLKDKKDLDDPTAVLLTRFRRNFAQWMTGSQHFNDNKGGNRRFSQRRYGNQRSGGGQIVDA